jgi:hypothetical protein
MSTPRYTRLVLTCRPGDEFAIGSQHYEVEEIKSPHLVVLRLDRNHTFRLSQDRWARLPRNIYAQLSLRSQGNLARIVIRAPARVPISRFKRHEPDPVESHRACSARRWRFGQ